MIYVLDGGTQEEDDSVNIGLIVGLSIAGVLVLVGIIVIVAKCSSPGATVAVI